MIALGVVKKFVVIGLILTVTMSIAGSLFKVEGFVAGSPLGGSNPTIVPPYPMSSTISLTWDPLSLIRTLPSNGDNWPATWGSNGTLYTSFGDGTGFGGRSLSLGLATISGNPFSGSLQGNNLKTTIDTPVGWGKTGIKASGLLMVDNILYALVRNYAPDGNYRHSRLAVNTPLGWQWAGWYFTNTFGAPDFIQYGPNYQGGDPTYVYIVSQDNNDAYTRSPNVVLARVPRNQIQNRNAYEFFSGTSSNPGWSSDMNRRTPIFSDPNGTQRVSISYNSALNRYFLITSHDDGTHRRHTNGLGVFDASSPWGPWTTDYYSNSWSLGDSYEQKFPPMYMSSDGKTMWMLFSGDNPTPYAFTLRKATLTVSTKSVIPSPPQPSPYSGPTCTSQAGTCSAAAVCSKSGGHSLGSYNCSTGSVCCLFPSNPIPAPNDCTCTYNSNPTTRYPKNHCDCGVREGNVCHFTRLKNYGSCT